jgi:hypothetical protein
VAFTDLLPLNMIDSGAVTTPQCGGGSVAVSTVGSRRQITMTGGSIPANSFCTVTVNTTSGTIGTYPNTSNAVTALINGTPVGTDTASDTLTVTAAHPAISILKQVSSTGSDPWTSFLGLPIGVNVYYRFVVENTGDVTLNNVTVTDPAFTMTDCSWEDGDGNSLPDVFTLPAPDTDEEHIAYCVLGPVTAASGTHTNTATVDSDETGPETDRDLCHDWLDDRQECHAELLPRRKRCLELQLCSDQQRLCTPARTSNRI